MKEYTVTSITVSGAEDLSVNIGNSIHRVSNGPTVINLTIETYTDVSEYDTLESFQGLLDRVPEWCSGEMLHKALKNTFPERYL